MQLYMVYLYCLNGNSIKLNIQGENYTIEDKVKEILKDNQGGSAEVYGDNFYAIIDL